MNETQEKIYGLLESYLEYCKTNGYTEFEVWCEDNIDTINEDALIQDIPDLSMSDFQHSKSGYSALFAKSL